MIRMSIIPESHPPYHKPLSMATFKFITPLVKASASAAFVAASATSFSANRHYHHHPLYSFSSHLQFSRHISARRLLQGLSLFQLVFGGTNRTMVHSQPSCSPATPSENQHNALPDLMIEFMVDMKCQGCVSAVRNKLEKLEGVKRVDIDLDAQVVRVLGSTSLKTLNMALEETGRKSRLIGQGTPEEFLLSSGVAEFKGPQIHGVVRFAQVTMELARVEASFSGLSEGPHGWSINEYGDLTQGAASTGRIFCSPNYVDSSGSRTVGDLGLLTADGKGEAEYSGSKRIKVADIIGRALVVYETDDKSVPGIAAAVIARSAGVGENYKKLCTCDGTIIWESTNDDYVKALL